MPPRAQGIRRRAIWIFLGGLCSCAPRTDVARESTAERQAETPEHGGQAPQPNLEWLDAVGAAPRLLDRPVTMALLTLPPGAHFEPPVRTNLEYFVLGLDGAPDALRFTRYGWDNRDTRPTRHLLIRSHGAPCPPSTRGVINAVAAVHSDPLIAAGGKLRVRILFDGAAGACTAAVSLLEGDADLVVPEHTHAASAEVLYIVAGSGHMRLGEEQLEIRPGVMVYVPPGVVHDFRGEEELRAVQVYNPGGPEQRFRASPP